MKKILSLSVAVILLAGTAIAQDTQKPAKDKAGKEWKKGGKQGMQHKGHGAMAKGLDLTDAQKQQMKSINEEYKAKFNSLKDAGVSKDDARFKALREEKKSRMQSILTAEQKAKMAEMKSRKGADMKGGGMRGGAGRAEAMQEELGLTNDQAAKLKAQNQSFRTQMQAIHKNESLSQEQKKVQMKALQAQHKEGLRSVLTAEQIQKMEDKRKAGKENSGRKDKRSK